ncbi:glycoside hydrolase domain-containing protein [uncultured Agrobacterium sp.]|uniref:glycoside hydrolase domain-containing protein n=1 Tax=uncultured Agrobacterium sp. TaxID=157277 RepID=UPI0025CB92F3|nr:glycoside hydrolase domain-containing protein [uncultured Agrobacterium sp.]
MSYRDDFSNAAGWSVVDISIRLNNNAGRGFLSFLKQSGVDTLIRYCASSARPKMITAEEAKFLSKEGFGILPVFQDSSRDISNFSRQAGTANAKSAMDFAKRVGQPKGRGSTILFAVGC